MSLGTEASLGRIEADGLSGDLLSPRYCNEQFKHHFRFLHTPSTEPKTSDISHNMFVLSLPDWTATATFVRCKIVHGVECDDLEER